MPVGLTDVKHWRQQQTGSICSYNSDSQVQRPTSRMQKSSSPCGADNDQQPQQVQRCPGYPHVQHIPQLYNWDCGLACVLMVLRALGCCKCDFQQLKRLSQTTSVWTVDLAHLLARFGAVITFTTITVGINSDYAEEWFYMEHLEHDKKRVRQLFQQAEHLGITVQERSLPLADLIAAVTIGKQLAILLVDRRKIDPWQATADVAWNYTTGVTSATSYTGHYILLVGYEAPTTAAAAAAATTDKAAGSLGSGCSSAGTSSLTSSHNTDMDPEHPAQETAAAATGQRQQQPIAKDDNNSKQLQAAGRGINTQPEVAAAIDAACVQGGFFWVHDPARSHGPVRVPVSVVECARKTFGTDEDILLVDVQPLKSSDQAAKEAPWCTAGHQQSTLLQHVELGGNLQQQYQQCVMHSDMQRSRSGQYSDPNQYQATADAPGRMVSGCSLCSRV